MTVQKKYTCFQDGRRRKTENWPEATQNQGKHVRSSWSATLSKFRDEIGHRSEQEEWPIKTEISTSKKTGEVICIPFEYLKNLRSFLIQYLKLLPVKMKFGHQDLDNVHIHVHWHMDGNTNSPRTTNNPNWSQRRLLRQRRLWFFWPQPNRQSQNLSLLFWIFDPPSKKCGS
jgi:hypothetical protein